MEGEDTTPRELLHLTKDFPSSCTPFTLPISFYSYFCTYPPVTIILTDQILILLLSMILSI